MLRGTNVLASYSYPVRPRIRDEKGVVSGIQPSVLVARTHTRLRIVYAITIEIYIDRVFDLPFDSSYLRSLSTIPFLSISIVIYFFPNSSFLLLLLLFIIVSFHKHSRYHVYIDKRRYKGKNFETVRAEERYMRSVDEARRVKRSALI